MTITYGARLGAGRVLLAPIVIVGLSALVTPAKAAPELEARVFDNGVQVGSTVTETGGVIPGTTLSDANFSSITFSAQGVPTLANPDLSSVTLDAAASKKLTPRRSTSRASLLATYR